MSASVAELRSTFDNVLARLSHLDRTPISVVGMALPLGMGDQAPTRLHVFPLGEPPSNDDRKWRFTAADLKRAVEQFKSRNEPLPILYDHGHDPSKGSKAAGWIDSVDLASDGLWANCRWTDTARQEIRSGEWGFRSPGWEGEEDEAGYIYAGPLNEISLVNKPAIGGMPPVVASSQPLTQPTPPAKEQNMANEQTAAKKAAASDWSREGLLAVIKTGFPSMFGPDFPDDQIAELAGDLLEAGAEDEVPGAPGAKPPMPGVKSETPTVPAVPLFTSAEDVAKVEAATAAAKTETAELKAAKDQIASQEARLKALEARELTGKIVKPSGADRTANSTAAGFLPDAPSPHDHVGRFLVGYKPDTAQAHQTAIAYIEKAQCAGKRVSYQDAVVAVTRKSA